jgi:hypothetical protein
MLNLEITGLEETQSFNLESCSPITFNGVTFEESGYYELWSESQGVCDTLYQLDLSITDLSTEILIEGNTLQVSEAFPGAEYSWANCANGQVLSEGETEFVIEEDGLYSVRVEYEDCEFIADCISANYSSVAEWNPESIKVYPNPVNDQLNVEGLSSNDNIDIYNAIGQRLMQTTYRGSAIDVSKFRPGVYILKFENNSSLVRFVKD